MTLPIDVALAAVAAGSAIVGSVVTGTALADSVVVWATIGFVVVGPAQAVSETKLARLSRKMTFKIKFFMGASLFFRGEFIIIFEVVSWLPV
jgi:hypothetical protein